MKSSRLTVSMDPDTAAELETVASKTPFKSANMLLAAAGAEFAKLKKSDGSISNIWHALARITDDENETEQRKRVRGAPAALTEAR